MPEENPATAQGCDLALGPVMFCNTHGRQRPVFECFVMIIDEAERMRAALERIAGGPRHDFLCPEVAREALASLSQLAKVGP